MPVLIVMAQLSAAISAPAQAQEDARFSGKWEPYSTTTGGNTLYLDPVGSGGFLTFRRTDGQFVVEQYEIIRNFGDHMVIRVWGLAKEWRFFPNSDLVILDMRGKWTDFGGSWSPLRYYDCGGSPPTDFFFQDHDPDNIWRRIQEWSARAGEGRPYILCNIDTGPHEEGILGIIEWGSGLWVRYVPFETK